MNRPVRLVCVNNELIVSILAISSACIHTETFPISYVIYFVFILSFDDSVFVNKIPLIVKIVIFLLKQINSRNYYLLSTYFNMPRTKIWWRQMFDKSFGNYITANILQRSLSEATLKDAITMMWKNEQNVRTNAMYKFWLLLKMIVDIAQHNVIVDTVA